MAKYPSLLPDDAGLAAGIQAALNASGAASGPIRVLEREGNLTRSTVPCELVLFEAENGHRQRLFCKFGAAEELEEPNHRLGVAYEAAVYEHVLSHSRAALPRYFGHFIDPTTGVIGLVLEYVDGAVPIREWPDPAAALPLAARWLADFHAEHETRVAEKFAPPLKLYDAAYYQCWPRRVAEFSRPLHAEYAWLPQLCRRAEECFQHLLAAPMTVIHGECYSTNWLVDSEVIMAIDWESAAVASAAIDVASLGWGWEEEETAACTLAYQQARWLQGPPTEFAAQLAAARVYLSLRWLGDCPEWTTSADSESFAGLKYAGEAAGLL